jgi:thioredoxin reductase
LPAPASELLRQHGGKVRLDLERGGFCALRGTDGESIAGVFAAGDIAGYLGPDESAADGARIGAAVARGLTA